MTEYEFLEKLKKALENDLDSRTVQENMDYYRSYIEEETRHGRSEGEVLEELGDPWVLAQSVINMAESRSGIEAGSGDRNGQRESWSGNAGGQGYSDTRIHTYMVNGWWKRLLFLLGVIGIVLIVFAVIGGLISLIMPVLLPIFVVVLILRFIRRMR